MGVFPPVGTILIYTKVYLYPVRARTAATPTGPYRANNIVSPMGDTAHSLHRRAPRLAYL